MQAWLDAVPDKWEQSRRAEWVGGMPEAGSIDYLADWFYEVGPVSHSGLPIAWPDINAWMQSTGTDATPWEQRALIDLSIIYCNQAAQSRDPSTPAPWADASKVDHAALAARRRRRHAK